MQITQVEISKFRSIEHLVMSANVLTVLCGANSAGKSNVLRAIRFAFVPEFTANRMAINVSQFVTSPNAIVRVKLSFDKPTTAVAAALSLPAGSQWDYEVDVKRSGAATYKVNGSKISDADRQKLLNLVTLVFVPPIRDIAGDGLLPFKRMLGNAIRHARGGATVTNASTNLRSAVTTKGRELLSGAGYPSIGALEVNVAEVDFEAMLSDAIINVRNLNGVLPLDGFGTGHQSQVVLGLYRQLGQGLNNFVIYQFEEPDNHMHSTAMRSIAEDLVACSLQADSQVFITTHSPALMNQFELRSAVSLVGNNGKTEKRRLTPTLTDREYRVGLSQFGMRPAEALTARLVVVVEGATDVTLLRTLYAHHHRRDPERDDVLIIPAGGKELAVKLAAMLNGLGVNWRCVLDYDAAQSDSRPHFTDSLSSAEQAALIAAIDALVPNIFSPTLKSPKSAKILSSMRDELATGVRPDPTFNGSLVARLVDQLRSLSAVDRAVVGRAILDGKHSKWRDLLWKSGVWLWSKDPEELVVGSDNGLDAAEAQLRAAGELSGVFPDRQKLRQAVANKLHDLAAKPDLLARTLQAVFESGSLGTDQFHALARKIKV